MSDEDEAPLEHERMDATSVVVAGTLRLGDSVVTGLDNKLSDSTNPVTAAAVAAGLQDVITDHLVVFHATVDTVVGEDDTAHTTELHNSYSSGGIADGVVTVPITGLYSVTTTGEPVSLHRNDALERTRSGTSSGTFYLNKGDEVSVSGANKLFLSVTLVQATREVTELLA